MPDSPIFSSFYQDRSKATGNDLCVNLYAEHVDGKDAPEIGLLVSRQGLSAPVYSLGSGPVNGIFVSRISGGMYVASGTNIYYIATPTSTPVVIGTILANNAQVEFTENTTQVFIIDGQGAWVYNKPTGVYTQVIPNTTTNAQYPSTLVFQDGFVLVNAGGTNQLYQSNYGDLSNFATPNGGNLGSTANNAYAQGDSTNIVAIAGLHHEVWVFKQRVTEVWINQGAAGFAFAQLQGVYMQFGCMAPASIELVGESLVWLGQDANGDCVALVSEGYKAKIVSTPSLTQTWNAYSKQTDAIAYSYQLDGHYFYVLTFPTGNETYVYDLVTQKWHQRGIFTNGSYSRELANCYEVFNGVNLVGDYASGNIYALSDNNITDNGKAIRWLRRWSALPSNVSMVPLMSFDSLQVLMETGLALPQVSNNVNYVYSVNEVGKQVDMMGADLYSGLLSKLPTYSNPLDPSTNGGVVITPNKSFAYIGSPAGIRQYSISRNGVLTPLSPSSVSEDVVNNMVISNDGNFLYATNTGSGLLAQYSISSSGQLSPLSPRYVGPLHSNNGCAITPNGQFIYVSDINNISIRLFTRNQSNGQCTDMGDNFSLSARITSFAAHPNGKYLYCLDINSLTLRQFSINQVNGNLTALSTPFLSFSSSAPCNNMLTIRPDGNFLYVPIGGSNTALNAINIYSSMNGALNLISTVNYGLGKLSGITFSEDGTFLYVEDVTNSQIVIYLCDKVTGLLANSGTFQHTESTSTPTFINSVNLPGLPTQANPQVMLRWSDDGGYTWTNYFSMSAGLIGATAWRVIQNRLGSATIGRGQQRIFEISSVDQFQAKIYGAVIEGGPA